MRRFFVTLLVLAVGTACLRDTTDDVRPPSEATERPAPAAAPVPEARTEVGAARLGTEDVLVVGGLLADGEATARVDHFVGATGRWRRAPDLPHPLHHAGVAAFAGRVFVAGGYSSDASGSWRETAEVWSLGPGDEAWRAEPRMAHARGALGLAATPAALVAFGGTTDGQVVATAEVLRAGADAWRFAPPMRQAREHLAAASSGGRVYAIAGRVGGLETNLASVESFSPTQFAPEWREEPALVTRRGGTAAAAIEGRICVAGGEEPGGTIAAVECLDGGAWRVVADLTVARHGLGVVATDDGHLRVLAGGPEPGLFVSDAHEVLRPGRAPAPTPPG